MELGIVLQEKDIISKQKMINQELKIKFLQDQAYLAEGKSFNFDQLGLPEIAKSFEYPAYWTIRVLKYWPDERRIFAEILSYQIGETNFPSNQKALFETLNNLNRIVFRSIDTKGLLITLKGTNPVVIRTQKKQPIENNDNSPETATTPARKQIINDTFFIPLKKVRFIHGGVSFHKKFKEHKTAIELSITNYEIREEFDAVKNYFANVLKTKKIQVNAKIEILNKKIISATAQSPEIERIDKQLIDNVRFEFVKATKKKKVTAEIDKSLFTMEEYFDAFSDEKFESNAFYRNERELFEDLLQISQTKHYKNLRYLSSIHAHEIMRLRFVHKPFSFIFLINGDRKYHLIWETLDTEEATYIWHIDKNITALKQSLKRIEDIINIIKHQGKTAYINSTEDSFRRIYHDYSGLVDGFVKWKGELESILI